MKIDEAIDKFLRYEYVNGSTPATILHYKNQLKFFKDFMKNCNIVSITFNDYQNYIVYLKNKDKSTRVKTGEKEKLSGRTVKTYASALKTFLTYLYKNKYIPNDIGSEITMPRYKKKTIIILNKEQISILINSQDPFSFTGIRNLFIISLMLDCGLRLIEVCRLRACDIFLDKKLLKADGKGQKERLVPMSETTIYYYKIYLYKLEKKLHRTLLFNEILLKNRFLNDISKNTISLEFKRLKKKLGFDSLYPHLLRHTFATMFILNGGDIVSLQMILGHTTLNMSLNYLHLANQLKLAEQAKFSPLSNL